MRSPHKSLKLENDKLWADCIKARAGYKSEMSGKTENLHAHHLRGKPNYRLRYELENGICLTGGEHFFVAHNTGRQKKFESFVRILRGYDIFAKLDELIWDQNKTDLQLVNIYLKKKLEEFKSDFNNSSG